MWDIPFTATEIGQPTVDDRRRVEIEGEGDQDCGAGGRADLKPVIGQVMAAVWQVMSTGTPHQQAQAQQGQCSCGSYPHPGTGQKESECLRGPRHRGAPVQGGLPDADRLDPIGARQRRAQGLLKIDLTVERLSNRIQDRQRDQLLQSQLFEQLLGDEVYHFHHKMMLKEPRVGGAWEWHQDYGYWYKNGCLLPDMVSCLVALDPARSAPPAYETLRGLIHREEMNQLVEEIWMAAPTTIVTPDALDKRTTAEDYMRDWQDGWARGSKPSRSLTTPTPSGRGSTCPDRGPRRIRAGRQSIGRGSGCRCAQRGAKRRR